MFFKVHREALMSIEISKEIKSGCIIFRSDRYSLNSNKRNNMVFWFTKLIVTFDVL